MTAERERIVVVPKESDFENLDAYANAYLAYLVDQYPDRIQTHSAEAEKIYSSIVLKRWDIESRDGD